MTKIQKQIVIVTGISLAVAGIAFLLTATGIISFRFPGSSEHGNRCANQPVEKAQEEFRENVLGKEAVGFHPMSIVRYPNTSADNRRAYHCKFLPLALELNSDEVRPYPDKDKDGNKYVPSVCNATEIDRLPDAIKNNQQRIVTAAKSVGRLLVHISKDKNVAPVFWETATLVAPDVVATTCHTLNSYVQKKGDDLELVAQTDDQYMVVDFQKDPTKYGSQYECKVTSLLKCSKEKGLDFALLQIEKECKAIKNVTPLVLSRQNPDEVASVALVGYPDSKHFIDYDTREVFDAELVLNYGAGAVNYPNRKDYLYAKYVRSGAALKDNCNKDSNAFLHPSTTTVGESGGALLDLTQGSSTDPLQIVAFHTCCATYFSERKGVA